VVCLLTAAVAWLLPPRTASRPTAGTGGADDEPATSGHHRSAAAG
jgi:hypothetical protein